MFALTVGKEKKNEVVKKKQSKFRQAKAYVISVLGEFAKTCQSKQVRTVYMSIFKNLLNPSPSKGKVEIISICHFQINLEARVVFSSSIGRGLIEEVKSISADFLLLRGSRKRTYRFLENFNSPQR